MSKSNKSTDTRSSSFKHNQDTVSYLDFFKKLKHLNLLEPSFGALGFLLATLFFICCFLYVDFSALNYQAVSSWLGSAASSSPTWESSLRASCTVDRKPEFLSKCGDGCDIFDGNWVWDESYPLYSSRNCSLVESGFKCLENGRPDNLYTKWRWQPNSCNLPRFDPTLMLEKLRNRRVVFVGDSIGRNQWESLLCMLASGVHDDGSIYEVNGSPITKHKGFLVFMFRDYNCTIEYYRAPFLTYQGRPPPGAPKGVKMTVRVDTLESTSKHWKDADVLLLNSGHWWNHDKTIRGGCYFQEGEEVKMEMSPDAAFQRSIETLIDWINTQVDRNKTQIVFRTYAPAHFRGGNWKNGGTCHLEMLPELGNSTTSSNSSKSRLENILDAISQKSDGSKVRNFELLNVSKMTARRKDGHPSVFYRSVGIGPLPLRQQDCSHWCLPGVPDSWNELLFALFLKRESS